MAERNQGKCSLRYSKNIDTIYFKYLYKQTLLFLTCALKVFFPQSTNSLSMIKTSLFCCWPNSPSSQLFPSSDHSPCKPRLHTVLFSTDTSVVLVAPDSTRKPLQEAKNEPRTITFGVLDLEPFSCWHQNPSPKSIWFGLHISRFIPIFVEGLAKCHFHAALPFQGQFWYLFP